MTPEEISFQENFLYPLFLLLIGGGLSVGLIKLFNFLHEIKLRRIEIQREEAQKNIDRVREDHRFELEIKERTIEKLMDLRSWCFEKFKDIMYSEHTIRIQKVSSAHNDLVRMESELESLINLYFVDRDQLLKEFRKMFDFIVDSVNLSATDPESERRKQKIIEFNKTHNMSMSDEEIDDSVKTTRFFNPITKTGGRISSFSKNILNTKIRSLRPE